MKPYYEDSAVTIYCGDSRELIPALGNVGSLITDPVWPNSVFPSINPQQLLSETLEDAEADRVVIHLGCDSDPRFLAAVPARWPFLRVCWMDYARPSYKGRILYGSDVAYVFGSPPESRPGAHVLPGKCMASRTGLDIQSEIGRPSSVSGKMFTHSGIERAHPCPRRLQHVQWLVGFFSEELVCDPFCGSGTTLLAAKQHNKKAIGIEINEEFAEIAANRLSQEVLQLT